MKTFENHFQGHILDGKKEISEVNEFVCCQCLHFEMLRLNKKHKPFSQLKEICMQIFPF